ncbi:MAG: glutathione S-transferase family protein [Candidatus Binataceae bacterium]
MIKLYGTSMSRAGRCLWALEEVGVPYEHVPTAIADTHKPEYLKINPNGHIPALDDDGVILFESMAINLYLAEKYGKSTLWPATVEDRARAYQWSFWGMTETEPHLIAIIRQRLFVPAEQKDEKVVQGALEALKAPFKVLDGCLKDRDYLLGKSFTIADLNLASILMLGSFVGVDLTSTPALQTWMQKCLGRPAHQKARGMK